MTLALVGLALVWWADLGGLAHVASPHLAAYHNLLIYPLAGCLTLASLLAQLFPIHIRHNAKVAMNSAPFLLMAILLPPALAVTAAFAGLLIAELKMRPERGGYYSDVASQVGRLTVVVLGAALIAHLPTPAGIGRELPLIAAALALWMGDVLTSPVVFGPITGDSPWRIIVMVVRDGGLLEVGQYLIGILGAVAAQHEVWTLVPLVVPILLVYVTGKRSKELQDQTRQILETMADTVDLRDPYTGGHSRRVADYSSRILRELDMHGPEVELIVWSARVHDIGKIGMPDRVLLKEGPLADDEWAIMQAHPEAGAELLKRYPDFARGSDILRHHHERWDGRGYPHRLGGVDIPFGARVVAVADSFDAMTSDRPYRKGMPVERALGILREGRGIQWDARVVDAFVRSVAAETAPGLVPYLQLVPPVTDQAAQPA